MKRNSWVVIAALAIGVLVVFAAGPSLLGRGGGCSGSWGMMEPWMHSGTPGAWSSRSLGSLGMIFMWLVLIGVIALAVGGIVWLVRELSGGSLAVAKSGCPSCGRDVRADWLNCPFCGQSLNGE
jgi:hypothetical protein